MQDTFLNLYPKLTAPQNHVSVSGLWLAYGDEPLLHQWLTDALKPHWQQNHLTIKRLELISSKTWQDVLAEIHNISLFGDGVALILTGNHKPDKYIQEQLEQFAQTQTESQNQNTLLWLLPKQDKRSQNSKWFTLFNQYGHVVDCHLYNEQQRQKLLQIKAFEFGLQLSNEAWQMLMLQTEHHLLSAYQSLWRLSYLFLPQVTQNSSTSNLVNIDVSALQKALVNHASYSIFDLSDAVLEGNMPQVVKIMEQLKANDEPTSLVLWILDKDIRLLDKLLQGQDPQSLGIWRNKQDLYQQACQRLQAIASQQNLSTQQNIHDMLALLFRCDQAIKGLIAQPAWELLLQIALRMCGQKLFY